MIMGSPLKVGFEEAKRQLTSQNLMVHFDSSKEMVASCDTSPYSIGAVLLHVMPDGTEKLNLLLLHPIPR